jgi:fatty acid-binding protein DegV
MEEKRMDNYTAMGIAEGFIESQNENQVIEAWQHLVDTGVVWSLQGWYGRNAARLIENGVIRPGPRTRNKAKNQKK